MPNKFIEKVKNKFIQKTEGNNKKNIENLVYFIILLIITVIAINTIWGGSETKTNEQEQTNTSYKQLAYNEDNKINSNKIENSEYNLEESLENILGKISGVRKSTSSNYIF